ncbi:FAD-dependent oxidoreductase [Saccharothrix sp. NPDC042600]|uniref:NAD(P)/FAD-dependent oxidoreductase n=1 Tax=Saccharothrix TaxID=2071 RepID=UPI0033DCD033|nr:NAD(P)-binding protein [Saccharothrix mutabilis subsp. capreolus]
MNVTVVGAGIAGVACARALVSAGVTVRVLERASVGGRMCSGPWRGRPVDTGAGYFTVSDDRFAAVVARWRAAGVAREWTDTFAVHSADGWATTTGPMRWAAPGGLASLVEDLADGVDVRRGHEVSRVEPGPLVDGEPADFVVLAMPAPEASRLLSADPTAVAGVARSQEWLPSVVAVHEFAERHWDFPAAFVNDHPVLTTLFDDGSRRGDGAPVLVAHSTAALADRFTVDARAAGEEMAAAVRELLDLPEPTFSDAWRWDFARPTAPGDRPFHLGSERIGLAGDAWGTPKVETAWLSGTALAEAILAS